MRRIQKLDIDFHIHETNAEIGVQLLYKFNENLFQAITCDTFSMQN